MLSIFENKKKNCLQSNYCSTKQKLSIVLSRAEEITKVNGDEGIYDYIRALLYPTMYKYIYDCLTAPNNEAPTLNYEDFWPYENFTGNLQSVSIAEKDKDKYLIKLNKDIIFTNPWNSKGIVSHLGNIGHKVKFNEDVTNHWVVIFYPMRVCFVQNGKHSIAQGILTGEGVLHATSYIDLTEKLNLYSYDGFYWINEKTKKTKHVYNHDFGLVWEVSKLLHC